MVFNIGPPRVALRATCASFLLVAEVLGGGKEGEPLLTTFLYDLLIVLVSVVLAVAGLRLVQRLVPLPKRERNNTVTGGIYAALYVMFGVSVGFSPS